MQNNTPSSSASIPVSSTPSAVGNRTQNSEMWLSLQESGFHGSKHSEQRKDVPFSKSSFNPTDKSSKLPRRQLSALRHDCVFTFTNGGSQPLRGSYFSKISFSPALQFTLFKLWTLCPFHLAPTLKWQFSNSLRVQASEYTGVGPGNIHPIGGRI